MTFNESLFEKYNIQDLLTPTDNSTVYLKRYWIVHDGCILRYKMTKSWQCNSLKQIVESMVQPGSIYEGCEILYLDYVYVPR